MNSFDAIIATCALLAGFAVMLGAINEQQQTVNEVLTSTNAKTQALKCASIIDSMFSNSAKEYVGELKCTVKQNTLEYTKENKTKTQETLTSVTTSTFLEVKLNEHYK